MFSHRSCMIGSVLHATYIFVHVTCLVVMPLRWTLHLFIDLVFSCIFIRYLLPPLPKQMMPLSCQLFIISISTYIAQYSTICTLNISIPCWIIFFKFKKMGSNRPNLNILEFQQAVNKYVKSHISRWK